MLGRQGCTTNKMCSLLIAWTDEPLGCSCQGKACYKPENWNALLLAKEFPYCKNLLLLNIGSCHQISLKPSDLDPVTCLPSPLALATLAVGQLSGAVMSALSSDQQLPFPLSFPISSFFSAVGWGPTFFLLQLPPLFSQCQNPKIAPVPPTMANNLNGLFPWSSQECRQHCAFGLSLCFFVFVFIFIFYYLLILFYFLKL